MFSYHGYKGYGLATHHVNTATLLGSQFMPLFTTGGISASVAMITPTVLVTNISIL